MVRPLLFLALLICVSSDCSTYDYDPPIKWPDNCMNKDNQSPVDVDVSEVRPFSHFLFPFFSPWKELTTTICECCFYNVTLASSVKSSVGSLILKDLEGQSLVYKPAYLLMHSPSEHTLNGVHYDVEVQIYNSLYSGSTNFTTAAVSLFFNGGAPQDSVFFSQFVNMASKQLIPLLSSLSLDSVINNSAVFSDYYIYEGSTTAPPCTENVLWVLMFSAAQTISDAQLAVLTSYWKTGNQSGNNRPTQELGSRRVYYKSKF